MSLMIALLLMMLLAHGTMSAPTFTWCDWNTLDWLKMKGDVVDWNATIRRGGVLNFTCVQCDPAVLNGIYDWGVWAETDLRKSDSFLCDTLILGGAIGSLYDAGLLEDLTDVVTTDQRLQWETLSFPTRRFVAEYRERAIAIPYQIEFPMLYYRRDLVSVPPKTWEELIEIAAQVNGTDMNNDGSPDPAICMDGAGDIGRLGLGVFASIMKYKTGERQGFMFDLDDADSLPMVPLLDTVGFAYGFSIIRRMYDFSWQGRWDEPRWTHVSPLWESGQCAMYLTWAAEGGAAMVPAWFIHEHPVHGTSRMPGSRMVYVRETRTLENCTLRLCPFMESGGINRPSLQAGGNRFVVRKNPRNLADIIDMIVVALNAVDVRVHNNVPYRETHFNVSWFVEAGWQEAAAILYLNAIHDTAASLHMVLFPPIPTIEIMWRSIELGMKRACRAGEFHNSTLSDRELASWVNQLAMQRTADAGYNLDTVEAALRAGFVLPQRQGDEGVEVYWIVVPVLLLALILISVGLISVVQMRNGAPSDDMNNVEAISGVGPSEIGYGKASSLENGSFSGLPDGSHSLSGEAGSPSPPTSPNPKGSHSEGKTSLRGVAINV